MEFFQRALKMLFFLMLLTPMMSSCGDDDEPQPIGVVEGVYAGETVTYPISDPTSEFITTKSTYKVVIDYDNNTAKLIITDPKFLEAMPDVGPMTFPGLKYAATEHGIKLSCDALTPEIADRPFSMFPITDFKGKMIQNETLNLEFKCNVPNRGLFLVIFNGSYVK